ncbi:MAG: helix-turn-helix domain-containing protein, partial [Pseudomonadales bacterium]
SAAILSLCQHDWAGNVRELANLVERMAILHPYGVVGVQDLPKKFRHIDAADEDFDQLIGVETESTDVMDQRPVDVAAMGIPAVLPLEGMDLKDYMTTLESSLIQQALDDSRGVVARAAERLHIRRTTLVEKMRKYGLHRESATKV